MGDELQQGDVLFAVGCKSRYVVNHPVGEPQSTVFKQFPQSGGYPNFGVGVKQPKVVVLSGHGVRVSLANTHARRAKTAFHPQLALAGEGDLTARVFFLRDVRLDEVKQGLQLEGVAVYRASNVRLLHGVFKNWKKLCKCAFNSRH